MCELRLSKWELVSELKLKPMLVHVGVAGERKNFKKLSTMGHEAILDHWHTMEWSLPRWSWRHYLLSLSFLHLLAPVPSPAIPAYLAGQASSPSPAQGSCVPVGAGTGPVWCTCPGLVHVVATLAGRLDPPAAP